GAFAMAWRQPRPCRYRLCHGAGHEGGATVAGQNIKLNAEEVLGQVGKIAGTMAEVSVPGPVPPPGPGGSPIDAALVTVALAAAEKAGESSTALSTRGTEHSAASANAVAALQTQ